MISRKNIFLGWFLLLTINLFAQFGPDQELVKIELLKSFDKIHAGSELKIAVRGTIEETWHINSNTPNEDFLIPSELKIDSDSFEIITTKFPEATEVKFGFSTEPVSVFEEEFVVGVIVKIPENIEPGVQKIPVTFTYQACNDATCMPPQDIKKEIEIEIVDNQTQIQEINSEIFSELDISYTEEISGGEDSLASRLESSGLLVSLILVFLGGLALNLTPCVYPLIPITIGYFGGQSEGKSGKLFMLGLLYVLGMALTYSIVGVITALSGSVFGALLQNPIVIVVIALIFIVLSLSMFGVYEFKLPDSLVMKAGGAKSGIFGAFFMGLTMGIVAAPCIGPFVLGLVTYVGAKGDPVFGFWMFFTLAVGLGTPYIFLAVFSGKIKDLPRAGLWMEGVKHIFGFILLGMAIYFINPLLPKSISEFTLPLFMLFSAGYLLIFDKMGNNVKGFRYFKIIFSVVVIGFSLYLLYPQEKVSPDWQTFTMEQFNTSQSSSNKMIIDFYADWCIPCKELDAITFSDADVIAATKNFDAYKVDMTKSLSEETERIRNEFNIVGMPTIIIFNSDGEEVERITGFVNADEFMDIISNVN